MIAILTKESFYIISMNAMEFMSLLMDGKMNSQLIRAKSNMHCSKEDFAKFSKMFEMKVPEIETCFCEYGENQYSMKSVTSIDDLSYYKGEDNQLYTCKEDYNLSVLSNSKEVTSHVDEAAANLVTEVDETGIVDEDILSDQQPQIPSYLSEEQELEEINIDYQASALDHLLKNLPHIQDFVPLNGIEHFKNYISKIKLELRREVTEPFLKKAEVDNIVKNGDTQGITIENSFGDSKNLLDSIINLPVFGRLVGHTDISSKMNKDSLTNIKFIRICPAGQDEDENIYGFVHRYDISAEDKIIVEKRLKERLKKENRSLRGLSAKEKFDEWEKEFSQYIEEKNPLTKTNRVYFRNIREYAEDLKRLGLVFPDMARSTGEAIWKSYEVLSFDNRSYKDGKPISITEQLKNNAVYQASKGYPAPKNGVIFLGEKAHSTLEAEKDSELEAINQLQIPDSSIKSIIEMYATQAIDSKSVKRNSTGADGKGVEIEVTEPPKINIVNPFKPIFPLVYEGLTMGGIDPLNPYENEDENHKKR